MTCDRVATSGLRPCQSNFVPRTTWTIVEAEPFKGIPLVLQMPNVRNVIYFLAERVFSSWPNQKISILCRRLFSIRFISSLLVSSKKGPIPHLQALPYLLHCFHTFVYQASILALFELHFLAGCRFLMPWDLRDIDRHQEVSRLLYKPDEGE